MKKLFAMAMLAACSLGFSGCWDTCDSSCYADPWDDGWYGYDYGHDDWGDPGFNDPWGDPYHSGCSSCSSCSGGCSGGCSSGSCGSCSSGSCGSNDNHNGASDISRPDDNHGSNGSDAQSCIRNIDCESGSCINGYCAAVSDNPISEPDPVVPECSVNSDCSADMICTEGRCIPCQTDVCDTSKEVECVFSSQCESGLCVDGACLAPGVCAVDSNCQEGQICMDGACIARPECLSDSECAEGKICNASNECEDDVECRKDADCGEGMLCLSNMCAQCRLNCECPNEGDICMNGACVAG